MTRRELKGGKHSSLDHNVFMLSAGTVGTLSVMYRTTVSTLRPISVLIPWRAPGKLAANIGDTVRLKECTDENQQITQKLHIHTSFIVNSGLYRHDRRELAACRTLNKKLLNFE